MQCSKLPNTFIFIIYNNIFIIIIYSSLCSVKWIPFLGNKFSLQIVGLYTTIRLGRGDVSRHHGAQLRAPLNPWAVTERFKGGGPKLNPHYYAESSSDNQCIFFPPKPGAISAMWISKFEKKNEKKMYIFVPVKLEEKKKNIMLPYTGKINYIIHEVYIYCVS